MMVLVFLGFAELRGVHEPRKVVEVEHCVVLAVLAEERDVLSEIHVLEVIGDETAIAALDALTEFGEDFVGFGHSFW